MLDGVEVVVDGERIPDHVPLWTLQGRTFTLDELRASTDVRWQLDEAATITVPKPGGLGAGVHSLEVTIFLRRSYIPPLIARTHFRAAAKAVIVPPAPEGRIKYGVSTYSYTGDVNTSMTLEDVFAEIADLGATGIEILGEGNIPDYPSPDPAWIDSWHGLVQKYGLTPTNYGSWVDTTRWHDRDLTAEEGAEQLQLDLRLAKQLGFTSVRPKFGVTSWDLDPHPIWQETVERVAGPRRRARRRHLPRDPHADADQAPGDPGIHRLHREERHGALQAAHRHRHLQHRADPRRLGGDRR